MTSSISGTIRIETNPDSADVYINSRHFGTSPLDIIDVAPGRYFCRIEIKDYEINREIGVYPNKITHIEMDFATNTINEKYLDILEEEQQTIEEQQQTIEEQQQTIEEQQQIQPSETTPSSETPVETPPSQSSDIQSIIDEIKTTNDLLNNIVQNTLPPTAKKTWYYNETTIQTSVPSKPVDPSSGQYQLEKVHDILSYNSDVIYLCNDGPGILFIVTSSDGKNFSANEAVIYEGECKTYTNIYTLGLRSPTKGLAYRVSERHIEAHSSQIFSGSRYKDRRDRKGAVLFEDDMESPTIKYIPSSGFPPTIARSNTVAYSGDFSVKINVTGAEPAEEFIEYSLPDTHFGKIGAQINFSQDASATSFAVKIHFHRYSGGIQIHGEAYIDSSGNIGIIKADLVTKVPLFVQILNIDAPNIWNSFKLVIDYSNNMYDKIILNGIEYDISNIQLPIIGNSTFTHHLDISIALSAIGNATPAVVFFDNFILTEDEP